MTTGNCPEVSIINSTVTKIFVCVLAWVRPSSAGVAGTPPAGGSGYPSAVSVAWVLCSSTAVAGSSAADASG